MKRHGIDHTALMNQVVIMLVLLAWPLAAQAQQAGKSPVKVFILAGQSNMQGKGTINGGVGTLEDLLKNDSEGAYAYLGDTNGTWTVLDDVWITYERSASDTRYGGLEPGYGTNNNQIGPELGFGHVIGDALDNQVLLIKTCWGGKSLAVDFRPPSSGEIGGFLSGVPGFYYEEMLRLVRKALDNLGVYFPDYMGQGYELAGIFWHQGWNDRVNQGFNDEYEVNMANFIRDVRKDLGLPSLPFVIATTGMSGWEDTHPRALSLMAAQLAMADVTMYPEFEGNVAVVDTRDFWRPVAESPSGQEYHWNSNAATYLDIGLASGEAMKELIRPNGSGTILREWWQVLDGATLAALRADTAFPHHPSGYDELTRFDTPSDSNENIAARIRGTLFAPTLGAYTFWLDSNTEAELWLSTNVNAESAILIAATSTDPQSSPISLQAGTPYYIEALHTAGHLAVAWEGPTLSRRVIEGEYLSPWTGTGPPALTIHNAEPQGLGMTFVTLGGEIVSLDGDSPDVLLFWGEADGSITSENWNHVQDLGTQSSTFGIDIVDLAPQTTYYFRTFCANAHGHDWADTTTSFSTLSGVATVDHLEPTNVSNTSVTLNGRINYLGAEPPSVTVYWGTSDGQTDAEAWQNSQDLGIQSGLISVDLTGLDNTKTNYFRFQCENSFGASWADSTTEFTLVKESQR